MEAQDAMLRIAACYAKQGDRTKAATYYKQVLQTAHDIEVRAKAQRGLAELSDDPTSAYQKLLDEYPGTWAALAVVLVLAKQNASSHGVSVDEELVAMADRFAGNGHGQQAAVCLFAASHARQSAGDARGAAELWNAILSRYPQSRWAAEAQLEIGLHAFQQGEWEKAKQAFETVLERYPDSKATGMAVSKGYVS